MIDNIILASKSGVRKKILNENGISCEVVPSNIDEDQIKESLLKEEDSPEIISDLNNSDVVLIGISRTSKTPTSIYLANRGYKVANIPLISNKNIPTQLIENYKKICVIGLVCDATRLSDVRRNRIHSMHEDKPGDYTNEKKILNELENSKEIFKRCNWPVIDVTRKSVEETAASIIKILDILNSK